MKTSFIGFFLIIMSVQWSFAQQKSEDISAERSMSQQQEIIKLSKEKWDWMSERKVDRLSALFHEKAIFILYFSV